MNLAERAIAEEQMDASDLPEATYLAVVGDLARVNRVTLAARPTLSFLDQLVTSGQTLKLLDVGFGDGDMLRRIHRWAAKRQVRAQLVGIDLNPRSLAAARAHTPAGMAIDWRIGDYADLADQGWDVIVSSLVAHHMSSEQLVAFLRFMESEARRGWLVNDLLRHRFAHAGFPVLARLFGWHRMVREDGRLSIARAFRPEEWVPVLADAGVTGARIFRVFPFRLCVERRR